MGKKRSKELEEFLQNIVNNADVLFAALGWETASDIAEHLDLSIQGAINIFSKHNSVLSLGQACLMLNYIDFEVCRRNNAVLTLALYIVVEGWTMPEQLENKEYARGYLGTRQCFTDFIKYFNAHWDTIESTPLGGIDEKKLGFTSEELYATKQFYLVNKIMPGLLTDFCFGGGIRSFSPEINKESGLNDNFFENKQDLKILLTDYKEYPCSVINQFMNKIFMSVINWDELISKFGGVQATVNK